jgi:hypothetical protein
LIESSQRSRKKAVSFKLNLKLFTFVQRGFLWGNASTLLEIAINFFLERQEMKFWRKFSFSRNCSA